MQRSLAAEIKKREQKTARRLGGEERACGVQQKMERVAPIQEDGRSPHSKKEKQSEAVSRSDGFRSDFEERRARKAQHEAEAKARKRKQRGVC